MEAGVWLPLATGSGIFTSPVSDVGFAVDRENVESYKVDVVSARIALRGEADLAPWLRLRGEVAPILSYTTREVTVSVGPDQLVTLPRTNGAATARLLTDIELGAVTLTGGALGRYEPKGGTDRFFDETWVSGLVSVSYPIRGGRPSVSVRVPLAGGPDYDFSFHAGVSVPL